MKNSNLKEQRKLLKGYGFTWYSALKILLFSIVFSSLGLSAFVLTSEYSFVKAKNEVVARVVNTYENIVKIYEGSQNGDNSYIASKVIGYKTTSILMLKAMVQEILILRKSQIWLK